MMMTKLAAMATIGVMVVGSGFTVTKKVDITESLERMEKVESVQDLKEWIHVEKEDGCLTGLAAWQAMEEKAERLFTPEYYVLHQTIKGAVKYVGQNDSLRSSLCEDMSSLFETLGMDESSAYESADELVYILTDIVCD